MIGIIVPVLVRWGLSQRVAKGLATAALIVVGAALLIGGFLLWDHFDDEAAVNTDRAESRAQAVTTAREADEAASGAVAAKQEDVEDGNERARAAAGAGDDPLGDGLRSLRAETGGAD